jgi:hypothetical protein
MTVINDKRRPKLALKMGGTTIASSLLGMELFYFSSLEKRKE